MNLLFVGRLEPRKGLTTLLQSLSIVKDFTNMPFRLLVVGNGFMTDYYKSRVPRDVVDKVFFIGEVSFKDIPRYYKTAHIFCSPATYGESFGIVLI
jgi:phosphatidylinositol alpha-mannosyltransferase